MKDIEESTICEEEPETIKVKITYENELKDFVKKVLDLLNQDYPIVKINPQDCTQANQIIEQISLKNRKFYQIFPLTNSSLLNDHSIWIHYSKNEVEKIDQEKKIIAIGNETVEKILSLTTAHLKMDFQWIGVCGRLGTQMSSFCLEIKNKQNFKRKKFLHQSSFLQKLNKSLQQFGGSDASSLFQKCFKESKDLPSLEEQLEKLICESFDERIILMGVVDNQYLKLLKSRNYFQLVLLEEPVRMRFNEFQKQCYSEYRNIYRWLTLENFLQLDEYWYATAIQKAMKEGNFTVSRFTKPVEPFSQIIQRNRRNIFKPFRPDFDSYFISICKVLKERAGCIKEAVGAIIVRNKRIVATGYNGTPMNCANCFNGGCFVCGNSEKMNTQILSCNCIHAEYGCIIEAGIQITPGCSLYSTKMPCLWCSKMIIQAKIKKVMYMKSVSESLMYDNQEHVKKIFQEAGVQFKEFQKEEVYFSQTIK